MTPEQHEHWQDFALRMARTCFKRRRRPNTAAIVEQVEQFFDLLEPHDVPCIVDWDNSTSYPEGHPWYSRKHRTACWDCHGAGCHRHYCEAGQVYDYARPELICDRVTDFDEQWVPDFWGVVDGPRYEQLCEQWTGPARACIRAALDIACSPSAGVVGFTAGDIRRMYPDGVPAWVARFFANPVLIDADLPDVGRVVVESPVDETEVFAGLADDEALWL